MADGRRKRQPRQSREALRDLLLGTGRTVLIEEGLGLRTDTLTFKRVFERVEADTGLRLSNASIIRRVWDNQADYQADVLASIAAAEGLGEFDKTMQALVPLIEGLDLSTPEGRVRSLREVCRIGGGGQHPDAPGVTELVAVDRRVVDGHRRRPTRDEQSALYQQRIRAALLEGYDGFTALWEDAYRALADFLGMRVRPPLTFRQLSVAVGALAEGCSLRQRVDEEMEGILRPTGPGRRGPGVDAVRHRTGGAAGAVLRTRSRLGPDSRARRRSAGRLIRRPGSGAGPAEAGGHRGGGHGGPAG